MFYKKKFQLVKVGKVGVFSWCSVKIRVIFSVRFERRKRKVDKKSKPTRKNETCKLCSRVFWIFLPNVIKIDPYNFYLYCFKMCAFL